MKTVRDTKSDDLINSLVDTIDHKLRLLRWCEEKDETKNLISEEQSSQEIRGM